MFSHYVIVHDALMRAENNSATKIAAAVFRVKCPSQNPRTQATHALRSGNGGKFFGVRSQSDAMV